MVNPISNTLVCPVSTSAMGVAWKALGGEDVTAVVKGLDGEAGLGGR